MEGLRRLARLTLRQARRVVLFVVGSTVVLLGLVMVVMPGPAILVIPAGLAILAVEFAWARRLLRGAKLKVHRFRREQRARSAKRAQRPPR